MYNNFMNYNYLLKDKKVNTAALSDCGFESSDGKKYTYRRELHNGLYLLVELCGAKLSVDVFDSIFNEKYAPFASGHGGGAIKSEVREILDELLARCCVKSDVKSDIINYIAETYAVTAEFPWKEYPTYCTFKTKVSGKWFALFMTVNAKVLGFASNNMVDVVNVKVATDEVEKIVDGARILAAYHMNKKHWVTVVLDSETDFDGLKKLVDQSYNAVESKKK